jgi:polyhydroxybutyrate depolymerase
MIRGMIERVIAIAMLALPLAAPGADLQRFVEAGGLKRHYVVHVPEAVAPGRPAALVVVFHGGGGNAANAARTSGMDARADREGFIVAYPDGTGRRPGATALLTWNTWRCCGAALDNGVDDVGFVRAMVAAIRREHAIDARRIYATGLSNGGMMTYRVACEASDIFAAVAPVAGALDTDQCRPASPVSIVVFHGTADRHVPFEGGAPGTSIDRHHRVDNPVAYAIDVWKKRDGCEAAPARTRKGSVRHEAYACSGGTAVELYAIEGQGHAWPGGTKGMRNGNVDAPSTEISATDVMWDFFEAHPKPAP